MSNRAVLIASYSQTQQSKCCRHSLPARGAKCIWATSACTDGVACLGLYSAICLSPLDVDQYADTPQIDELESTRSRFGHGFACLTRPCLRFALALNAGWLIMPAALSFGQHPILLNFTSKTFDGSFKGLAISDQNLCHVSCRQPGIEIDVRIRRLTSFLCVAELDRQHPHEAFL